MSYTLHRFRLDAFERRLYQDNIAARASAVSTLVVLPTGLGKTVVAIKVMDAVLAERGGAVLLMAPTRPLAEQHYQLITKFYLNPSSVSLMTGELPPDERLPLWHSSDIIVATPQVVRNDIVSGADLTRFSLLIFDECHRATGDYPYTDIAAEYLRLRSEPLVLAMTASPGGNMEKVRQMCLSLGIRHIETRTEEDADVSPYVRGTEVRWKELELPSAIIRVASELRNIYESKIQSLQLLDILPADFKGSVKELLGSAGRIQELYGGRGAGQMFRAMKLHAEALKIGHALLLAETQPLSTVKSYLKRMEKDATARPRSAAASIVRDPRFISATNILSKTTDENPKIGALVEELRNALAAGMKRVLVFTQYRETVEELVSKLSSINGVRVDKLIGQGARGNERGLKQKEQIEVLSRFREGKLNVLVSTSVGEEGLDIAATDLVIFFEPVPSEIRTIQRKGRTGRSAPGSVLVLMNKNTADEAYYHASRRKERIMKENLMRLDEHLQDATSYRIKKQSSLLDFSH
ncbi:MAG: helicase-related protein [Methanomassiliicoccales archaeon]